MKMKNLLYKELKLGIPGNALVFLFLSITIAVPSYPSLVAYFYTFAGILMIIPTSITNRDFEYTSNLPIRKKDVVKGKTLLFGLYELTSLLVSVPFALIKALCYMSQQQYQDLGINIALFGIVLIVFAVFNLIFIPWYYKNPQRNLMPTLVSIIVVSILLMGTMFLFIIFPQAAVFLNTFNGLGLLVQFIILFIGLGSFVLSLFLASRIGGKHFEKVDL